MEARAHMNPGDPPCTSHPVAGQRQHLELISTFPRFFTSPLLSVRGIVSQTGKGLVVSDSHTDCLRVSRDGQ